MDIKLHRNAVIDDLLVENTSTVDSIAPEYIETDSISFRPIYQIDFNSVLRLFRQTSDEVFYHHGDDRHILPDDTREYVKSQKQNWIQSEKFEYGVIHNGELIGVSYLNPSDELDSFEFGLWLQREYWGNGFSQERADAFLHIAFSLLDASFIFVGCALSNVRSRHSIEKYVRRYNGSFFGCSFKSKGHYRSVDEPTDVIKHPDWGVSKEQFWSMETGISSTIPGSSYEDIEF